ncbi:DeoR/GlpR family DNA-binding transcription regulator [Bacillus sp. MAG717A]|uniref:DeoR/GlpR family DNA-binding transcription regulator n=1 Tax=Bacillus sp. MAG717A TaxID=3122078 RepID=UPI0030D0B48B
MLKNKRLERIKQYVIEHQCVSLDDLVTTFEVSKNTIRRDVQKLVEQGHFHKVYGGVAFKLARLESFDDRQIKNQTAKQSIARVAASMVKDGDTIFIDSGTTTLEMIHYIHQKTLTIVTNNMDFIFQAIPFHNLTIISTGGFLERKTKSFSDHSISRVIDQYNFDQVFMASTGVSITNGVTNSSPVESSMKEVVVKKGGEVFLLVDHTKFDKQAMVTYCTLNAVNYVITDKQLSERYQTWMQTNNVKLIVTD